MNRNTTLLGIILLALSPSPGWTDSQLHMSFREVVNRAEIAFHGQVIHVAVEPHAAEQAPHTDVTFAVFDLLYSRGAAVGNTVTLTFAGGTFAEGEWFHPGMPGFRIGDEVVLFARHDGNRYANPIIGGTQGHFPILRDEMDGRAYPLTSGRLGIASEHKGSLWHTTRVETIRNGAIRYASVTPLAPVETVGAPTPAPGGARSASVTARAVGRRPVAIMTLDDLLQVVANRRAELPEGRR